MIRTLEELGMNAWPSLQTVLYNGWVLRFSGGYTRRANSVHPLYPSNVAAEEKIAACERLYRAQGLAVIFKIAQGAAQPENLDDLLAARGYAVDALTGVQVADLEGLNESCLPRVQLTEGLSDEWLDDFCRLSKLNDQRKSTSKRMLSNLILPTCFVSIRRQGQVVGCGIGVLQERFIGLFDIITGLNFRQQGFGEQLVRSILDWGKSRGAQTAYLQVMLNNEPALRLYSKLGFNPVYQYWYRIKA